MPGPLNTIVLTLIEVSITLYPANAAGEPLTNQPLWHGVAASDFTVRDRWLKVETRPTGAKYPRRHNLVPQFEISIDRVWALPLAQLQGFNPAHSQYVLDVIWREEDTNDWHREVFYGVTINERTRGARDRDGEFTDHQVFDAESMAAPTSGRGTPPALTVNLPYTVRYLSPTEDVELYRYDATTKLFAAAASTTGRAVLETVPGNLFTVTFASQDWNALKVSAAGDVAAMNFFEGVTSELPRVDFYYGSTRVASVTRTGKVFAPTFQQVSILPTASPQFALTSASAVQAGLRLNGLYAANFTAFTPDLITGLKLWLDIADLAGHEVPLYGGLVTGFDFWPDRSGNQNVEPVGDAYYLPTGAEFINPTPETDGRPAVFLDKDTSAYLRTLGNVVSTGAICAFVICKPGQRDGVSGGGSMSVISAQSDPATVAGGWLMQLYGHQLEGNLWMGGTTRFQVNGTQLIGDQLVENSQWWLLEQETTASALTVRVNGVLEATGAVTGSYTTSNRRIYLGAGNEVGLSFGGLLRAVVVYQGTLTAEEKAKVRQYLNNAYAVY